jgi:hypothetical protein
MSFFSPHAYPFPYAAVISSPDLMFLFAITYEVLRKRYDLIELLTTFIPRNGLRQCLYCALFCPCSSQLMTAPRAVGVGPSSGIFKFLET